MLSSFPELFTSDRPRKLLEKQSYHTQEYSSVDIAQGAEVTGSRWKQRGQVSEGRERKEEANLSIIDKFKF